MAKYFMGFIGIGNMGGTIARTAAAGTDPKGLVLADRATARAAQLAADLGCESADNQTVARECRYIFLGVKPHILPALMEEIAPILRERQDRFVLVSMAAGVEIERIRALAGGDYPMIRMMPNTPMAVGRGVIMCCTAGAEESELFEWKAVLAGGGRIDELPEPLFDVGTAVAGCGPAYAYLFIEALADGAVECGLPRDKAQEFAAATVAGAADMVLRYGQPGALKDAVCSPGGSTIVGVHALESRGFRAAAMDAVTAAFRKTQEMGK